MILERRGEGAGGRKRGRKCGDKVTGKEKQTNRPHTLAV